MTHRNYFERKGERMNTVMKKGKSGMTAAGLALAIAATLSLSQAKTFDFSEGRWDRGAFFEARNNDLDRGSPIVQMPDCIMNANDPDWSDEDLFKNHQADVFSSLILTNRFRGNVVFSSRMSFDHRMAPALVIAGDFEVDSQGRTAFLGMYEIVLFEDGINVWRHRRRSGEKSEIEKVAYARRKFEKHTQYEMKVALKRSRVHGGRLTTDIEVSADGVTVGLRDETVPAVYSVGIIGSEGRCRFYDFKVDDAALAAASLPRGGLSLGRPFTDGAVLQSGRPIPVWGRATPGEKIRVAYGGASATATADKSGNWRVSLPALPASSTPRSLVASTATSSVSADDVVVGEVWLCAGQSNMAMALVDPKTARYRDGIGAMVAQATDKPLVRYLQAPPAAAGWRRFTPEFLSGGRRASIAVHYALELHEKLGVPVGVVVAAVGGCNIDSFLPGLNAKVADLDGSLLKGVYPYGIRGAVWYQGETNIYLGEVDAYGGKMRMLYDRWSEMFANPRLSFYYVQLAPFARGKVTHKNADGTSRTFDYDEAFPRFLRVQAAFEKAETNAAMTVINDLGCIGDIHPNEKWLVAKRLALHALRRDYGFDRVEDRSPEAVSATASSNVVKVAFAHAKALYAYQRGQRFSPDLPFELAGAGGVWHNARVLNFVPRKAMNDGTIADDFILLEAPGVAEPKAVRYAWKKPWAGVVYNEVDLPLGTFEMDVK